MANKTVIALLNSLLLKSDDKESTAPSITPLKFILVEGGTFTFQKGDKLEQKITIPTFYMTETPITQAQWQAIMGNNPSDFKGLNRPVTNIRWDDIHQKDCFLSKLNETITKQFKDDLASLSIRLPTEVEWEYAALGGDIGAKKALTYAGCNTLNAVGWFDRNAYEETMPVKLKAPNTLGLYDMCGNVWEWCHNDDNPKGGFELKGLLNSASELKAMRGGSSWNGAGACASCYRTSIHRYARGDAIGFRLVVAPSLKASKQ